MSRGVCPTRIGLPVTRPVAASIRVTVLSRAFVTQANPSGLDDGARVVTDLDRLADRLRRRPVDPAHGVVAAVRDPDGLRPHEDPRRRTSDADRVSNLCRRDPVDPGDGVGLRARHPDGILAEPEALRRLADGCDAAGRDLRQGLDPAHGVVVGGRDPEHGPWTRPRCPGCRRPGSGRRRPCSDAVSMSETVLSPAFATTTWLPATAMPSGSAPTLIVTRAGIGLAVEGLASSLPPAARRRPRRAPTRRRHNGRGCRPPATRSPPRLRRRGVFAGTVGGATDPDGSASGAVSAATVGPAGSGAGTVTPPGAAAPRATLRSGEPDPVPPSVACAARASSRPSTDSARSGSLASARATTASRPGGAPGIASVTTGGSSLRWAKIVATSLSRSNGRWPVTA